MGYRLGIDLGTTFTAAAVLEIGAGQGSAGVPAMVGLGNRALQIPSVLYLQDDGFLVGEAAERRGQTDPSRVVREFKRRLGDPVPLLVGGTPFSAHLLSAKLLSWVVAAATERHGAEPDEIVLTHPANWGPYRREFFDQIIALARIGPASTCPEPQAAAIQYAAEARLDPGSRVVVYDLGGGTFDVCVLEKTLGGFKILGTPDGIENLGGIDFDEAVFRHVLDSLGAVDLEGPAADAGLSRLRRDCVEAKEALSVDVDTVIPVTLPGCNTSARLTRGDLEALIEPALTETVETTARALRAAGTSPDRLSAIVLVGGSSRIPLVSHLLQSRFATPIALDTHPKHAIALGAALFTPPRPGIPSADTPTVIVPVVDEPPTREMPPATPIVPPAAPAAPTGSTSPAYGTPGSRRRLPGIVAAIVAVAGIATIGVLFATRDKTSGEAGIDPGSSQGTSVPTDAGSSVVPTGDASLYGVAVSPDGRRLYVSDSKADALSAIDAQTGQLVGSVPVGRRPFGVAVSEATGDIYSANYGSGTVTRIDGSTFKPDERVIKVGKQPQAISVLPGTETAYVANSGDGTVSVLDLSTNKVIRTISIGHRPLNPATDANGRRVYVANLGTDSVSVIDTATNKLIRTLRVGKSPHDVAVSPDSELLYVTFSGSSNIAVVDATGGTGRAPIVVGEPVSDLVVAPAARRLYAMLAKSGKVAVFDTTTMAPVGDQIAIDGPAAMALSPDGKSLYVTANRTSSLTAIDTATGRAVGEPFRVPSQPSPVSPTR